MVKVSDCDSENTGSIPVIRPAAHAFREAKTL
jgi:hypothetical protein